MRRWISGVSAAFGLAMLCGSPGTSQTGQPLPGKAYVLCDFTVAKETVAGVALRPYGSRPDGKRETLLVNKSTAFVLMDGAKRASFDARSVLEDSAAKTSFRRNSMVRVVRDGNRAQALYFTLRRANEGS